MVGRLEMVWENVGLRRYYGYGWGVLSGYILLIELTDEWVISGGHV